MRLMAVVSDEAASNTVGAVRAARDDHRVCGLVRRARRVRREDGGMRVSEFINADCMEYLPKYPDNYFDLAICDPPYGGGGQFRCP